MPENLGRRRAIHLLREDNVQYATAFAAINQCRALGHELVIVPQGLYEFGVVITRPANQNGLGWTTDEADLEIRRLVDFFRLLRDERAILSAATM